MASGSEPAGRRTSTRGIALLVLIVPAVLLVLALLSPGWLGGAPQASERTGPRKLTIAVPSTPHAALLHIAAAQGYFAHEGLDVTVTRVSHGKAALDELAAGKADMATAAEVPFVIAVLQGAPLSIAATVVNTATEMAVVARRDRGIAVPRDLTGKRVGVSLGTSGEYFLWAFLIRHRLQPDAITWVDLAPQLLPRALASGSVDAIATWEPVKSAAAAPLAENALTFAEGDAYTVTHSLVGRSADLQDHPEVVEKLVRALLEAEKLVRADRTRALALVATQLKLTPEMLASVWNGLTIRVDLRQSQLVTLEDEARWAMARGYAVPGPVPNFLPRLHLDTLLSVAPDRVTVVR
jgi:ABC-type nitrate/sulfonate/bicarbonate transport system substrate-binding protein